MRKRRWRSVAHRRSHQQQDEQAEDKRESSSQFHSGHLAPGGQASEAAAVG